MDSRGLSPVFATIILIILVVVVSATLLAMLPKRIPKSPISATIEESFDGRNFTLLLSAGDSVDFAAMKIVVSYDLTTDTCTYTSSWSCESGSVSVSSNSGDAVWNPGERLTIDLGGSYDYARVVLVYVPSEIVFAEHEARVD